MISCEQCIPVNGQWHVVTQLHANVENTWKETVEFAFYLDTSGQPRIDVMNRGIFTRSTPRATWKLEGTRRRKLTKAEKQMLIEYVRNLVGPVCRRGIRVADAGRTANHRRARRGAVERGDVHWRWLVHFAIRPHGGAGAEGYI